MLRHRSLLHLLQLRVVVHLTFVNVQKPAAPAAARPAVARPAAPAKPAVNELKPKTIEASALYAEMKRLHDEEGMDFLLNLTGEDWLEDGIGVVYQVENTENHKQACVKCVVADRENPMIPSVSDLWDIANVYESHAFADLLYATVNVTQHGVNLLNDFALKANTEVKHTMCRGVLRTDVDNVVVSTKYLVLYLINRTVLL